MGRLTVTGALVCWLAVSSGCQYTSFGAESGALACTNGLDEDGDDKADCADPDCWGYAKCRVSQDAGVPYSEPPTPPVELPDDMGAFMPPEMTDSGAPIEQPIEDASMIPDVTTDAEPPAVCDPSCPEDLCVDGVCTKPPSLGYYVITSLQISVPRALDDCLDPDAACSLSFQCCAPDPALYVSVAGVKLGFKTANDAAFYVWQAPGFTFELHEYDEIKLEVVDDDANDPGDTADGMPDNIFECTTRVTPADVEAGSVRCAPGIEGMELIYPYGVIARFAPMADGTP